MNALKTLTVTLAVLALLLGISPSLTQFWFFSFIGGMRVHIASVALCLAILSVALDRSIWTTGLFFIAIVFALWVWHLHQTTLQPSQQPAENTRALKFIEFNILGDNKSGAEIADWLIRQDADIVYTLESEPLRPYLDALSKTYPYRAGCGELVSNCDLMMMSKYPLENPKVMSLGKLGYNRYIRAGIDVGGARATFVAMHLTKPYYEDLHAEQLRRAEGYLKNEEGPLVLAGDFNSSLLSPDILTFLKDTNLRAFDHERRTWPVEAPAIGLPIDHILVRAPAHIGSLKRIPDNMGSNHYGLIALISLPETAENAP